MEDLRDTSLLLLQDGHCLRDQALDVCDAADAREATEFRVTSLETLRQMVAAGAGVTLLPELAARANASVPNGEDVRIRPFRSPPHCEIAVLWRRGAPRAAALQTFADCVREVAGKAGLDIVGAGSATRDAD